MSSPRVNTNSSASPSKMSRTVYPDQLFSRPDDISIPKTVSGGKDKKSMHKREDSSPNSVAFLGGNAENGYNHKNKTSVGVAEVSAVPISALLLKRKQWRCSSPTDRFRVEEPRVILRRIFIHRYILEAEGNLTVKA